MYLLSLITCRNAKVFCLNEVRRTGGRVASRMRFVE